MIPTERSHLSIAAITHPGMSGKNNEDRHAVSAYHVGADQPLPATFAIISDGIGGHRAGEVAAEIAVTQISQSIKNSDASRPLHTLREAIKNASQLIHTQSEADIEKRGMGATCACAWIIGNRLYIAYVGDSRIYLIRRKTILQLSKDHTWIQEALDAGILKTGQAQRHPNAHVIRRYLGSAQPVEPDTRLYLTPGETDAKAEANQGFPLSAGDQIILCSDGLTDLVRQDEMLTVFTSLDQEQALGKLTDLANQRGGHDNITIVALQVPDHIPEAVTAQTIPAALLPARKPRRLWKACLLISILFSGITVSILVGYLFLKHMTPVRSSLTASSTSISEQSTTIPSTEHETYTSPLSIFTTTNPPSITKPPGNQVSPTIKVTLTASPTHTLLP